MISRNRSLFAAVLAMALAAPTFAATIKVQPGPGTPLADGVAQLVDGDKLVISKGEYAERLILDKLNDVRVFAKRSVVLLGDGTSDVIVIDDCTNIRVKGIVTEATLEDGIAVVGSTGIACRGWRCEALRRAPSTSRSRTTSRSSR